MSSWRLSYVQVVIWGSDKLSPPSSLASRDQGFLGGCKDCFISLTFEYKGFRLTFIIAFVGVWSLEANGVCVFETGTHLGDEVRSPLYILGSVTVLDQLSVNCEVFVLCQPFFYTKTYYNLNIFSSISSFIDINLHIEITFLGVTVCKNHQNQVYQGL